jgi:hypothetical protein
MSGIPDDETIKSLDEIEARDIIEIHPGSKYMLLVEKGTPSEVLVFASERLREWWASDEPFIVIGGQFELVRVEPGIEEDEPEAEEESDSG